MASRRPATLVIKVQPTQCHSSTRQPPASRCLVQESIRQALLRHHQHSPHFLRCQLGMCINSQGRSHLHWVLNSTLAIFDRSHCRGITPLSQVQLHTAIHLIGCLTSHSTHYRSFLRFLQARWPNHLSKLWRKPVSCRDQAWIPPEPLHHVTIIQL